MQDIVPPKRPNLNKHERPVQKSSRLQGHSLDSARGRLFGDAENTAEARPIEIDESGKAENLNLNDDSQVAAKKRLRLHRPRPMDWWRAWGKKRKIITVLITVLLLVAGISSATSSLFWRDTGPELSIIKHKKPAPPPAPTTVASPLTGVQVTPEEAKRTVTGIMIENSPDARPQSGIQDAGIVYEAIAEGGITRFLTLYQEARPSYVGPVRSLRPYYIDFATPFDAPIAHVGGSPDALAQIRNGGKDLDQFFNSGSFWRVSSRYAPHNVYTSFDKMDALNASKGFTTSTVQSYPRKVEKTAVVKKTTPPTPPPAPTAAKIDMNISSANYNSHYDYDVATNTYLRSEGGKAHIATLSEADRAGVQLHPKNVVALIVPYSIVDSSGHSGYSTNGSGVVYVFQDGGVIKGTWSKASRSGQFVLKDDAGAAIKLNPGQTWFTLLADTGKVAYTP